MSKRRKQARIETTEPRRPSPLPWLMGGLLVLLVFLAYRPAAGGAFIWDDDDYVAQNPNLRTAGGLGAIWFKPTESPQYYPMVFTTYWLEYRLWGDDPRGYHETNVLLHAASAVLLWRLLRRLRVPGAYLAAAIFAVHPVMVESVAWITERKNTLSMLFYLSAAHAYLRFARADEDESSAAAPPQWGWYAAALGFFVLALLSKTVTASLPAALLLVLWWKGRLSGRHAALLAPFFVLGVVGGGYTGHLEREHVGASGAEWSYTLAQRLLIAGRAVWFYAAKLLVPYRLTFVYAKWPVDPAAVWQWLFPVAAVGLAVGLFVLRHRVGRGPLVAVLLFGGTLVPALGFVNVYPMRYTFVADHYQYHASVGLIVLLAAGITLALARFPHSRARLRTGVTVAIILVLFVLTLVQASIYRDKRTLWTDTVAKSPTSWMAWTNLGLAAAAESPPDMATARRAHLRALELAPGVADTRYNVGHLYLIDGDLPAARAEFERAIAIAPKYANAYSLLGYTLVKQGKVDDGLAAYRTAIEIDPRHAQAHFNLGVALRDRGDLDAAAAEFAQAAEHDPGAALPLRELANVRVKQERFADAVDVLGRLIAIAPGRADAHQDRGVALRRLGRDAEADAELREAARLRR